MTRSQDVRANFYPENSEVPGIADTRHLTTVKNIHDGFLFDVSCGAIVNCARQVFAADLHCYRARLILSAMDYRRQRLGLIDSQPAVTIAT